MRDKKMDNLMHRIGTLIKEKWWIVVLTTVLGLGIAFGASSLMEKQYSSTVLIFANSKEGSNQQVTGSEISLINSLIQDYRVFATSNTLINNVNGKLMNDGLEGISSKKVSVASQGDSRTFTVTVENRNPEVCCKAAGYIADELIIQINQLYKMDNVKVIDPPTVPTKPIAPNIPTLMLFGGFLGFFVGVILMYFIFMFDRAVKSVEDFETYFDVPVLGIIPAFDKSLLRGQNIQDINSEKEDIK